MDNLINSIVDNDLVITLIVCVILDTFLGCIRAIKNKKWNSCFGINGLLRKVAMIGSIGFLAVIDVIYNINLIAFIPKEIDDLLGNRELGVSSLFAIIFMLYESTSILKNMILCGLPIPIKVKNKLETLLKSFTTELDKK